MALGNPGRNQSEGGRTPKSDWGERFKREAMRGRGVQLLPPLLQPPLPAEVGPATFDRASDGAFDVGTVRNAQPIVYHGFDPALSGTMLYVDFFGSLGSRAQKATPIVRLKGYMGEYPADLQPRLTKSYPWNDPGIGEP